MKTLTDQLTQYAYYHQDPRNINTHFVGVPMIVMAVVVLMSRPVIAVGGLSLSLGLIAAVLTTVFYLRLDLRFGVVLGVVLALMLSVGQWLAAQGTALWLGAGVGLFVVGWIIQFVGHYYEGKKPAFVDDLVGLLIGPLFVTAELGFLLQMRLELKAEIHNRLKSTGRLSGAALA
ncbi:MAG: hypothetical protein CFE43_04020 [Burkholderiales bacterium PBB3]|nr:MAG: hypothetical protein CFE43_04020 [Burkholderiales bacterium PBB3]